MTRDDPSTVARFWSKVDKRSEDECWPWVGGLTEKGYGRLRLKQPRIMRRAHVFSYELHEGPVPTGKMVCHSCDNPPCCNPAHLWAGTNGENMKDAYDKGRKTLPLSIGESNGNATLTEADIPEIMRRFEIGENNCQIARAFNVTHQMIWCIRRGKNWTHITGL